MRVNIPERWQWCSKCSVTEGVQAGCDVSPCPTCGTERGFVMVDEKMPATRRCEPINCGQPVDKYDHDGRKPIAFDFARRSFVYEGGAK